jgi:hypothetical protein
MEILCHFAVNLLLLLSLLFLALGANCIPTILFRGQIGFYALTFKSLKDWFCFHGIMFDFDGIIFVVLIIITTLTPISVASYLCVKVFVFFNICPCPSDLILVSTCFLLSMFSLMGGVETLLHIDDFNALQERIDSLVTPPMIVTLLTSLGMFYAYS